MSNTKLAKVPLSEKDKADPGRILNRDLSLLAYLKRILGEAENHANPLLERLRFLSFSSARLDRFYAVRVAELYVQAESEGSKPSGVDVAPVEQLRKINAVATELVTEQSRICADLIGELEERNIHILSEGNSLDERDRNWLEKYFIAQIFPVLTPVDLDSSRAFPYIPHEGIALGLHLARSGDNGNGQALHALLPVPRQLPRFIKLPNRENAPRCKNGDEQCGKAVRFICLEAVLVMFIDELFPGYRPGAKGAFRILRDSHLGQEKKVFDTPCSGATSMKPYRHGQVVCLEIEEGTPVSLRDIIVAGLQVRPEDIFIRQKMVGLSDMSRLAIKDRPELLFPPFCPRYPERIMAHDGDIFAAIRQEDIIVHHPYESLDAVLDFFRQAASDPSVVSIRCTLSKTGEIDGTGEALKEAAVQGKAVTVLFMQEGDSDNEPDTGIARDLESAGVLVLYGSPERIIHAGLAHIVRREDDCWKNYILVGTGRYPWARDRNSAHLSCFTSNSAVARDVARIFNYATSSVEPAGLEVLSISPGGIRKRILDHIREEIYHAGAGKPARIWMKMNALDDKQIIEALYEAGQAGVVIDLVVRETCCLRPGVPGLSDNIHVRSLTGPFVERERIYCFGSGNGLPSENSAVYITSADMTKVHPERCMDVMLPVTDAYAHRKVQDLIMQACLADTEQSWHILSDGNSRRFVLKDGVKAFSAHKYFMNNAGFSGGGESGDEYIPSVTKEK